ncbi:MAG: sulfite exporter TauE/SafE family protein [Nitrosomonadales bacterium]|nr:sulfite exporter TauE/SafE family protein [Nitrosomonadales bacterium]
MAEIIIFIFSGVTIGIAAGLFGLGGGLIIVPVVTYCLVYFSGTPFNEAIIIGVSTSLASIIITGAMAAYAHTKNHNVDYSVVKRFIPGLIMGSVAVGFFFKNIPGDFLKHVFILYAFFIAFKLIKHQKIFKQSTLPNRWLSNTISFLFSIISGIVGIGGATLFVPFFIKNNIAPKLAIGTSSVLGFFIGLCASIAIYIGYLSSGLNNQITFGFVYIPAILFLTFPSLIFIKLSAGWLLKLDDLLIKKLFSLLLITIGILMLFN